MNLAMIVGCSVKTCDNRSCVLAGRGRWLEAGSTKNAWNFSHMMASLSTLCPCDIGIALIFTCRKNSEFENVHLLKLIKNEVIRTRKCDSPSISFGHGGSGGGYAECQVPRGWVVWEEKSEVITMTPKQEGRDKTQVSQLQLIFIANSLSSAQTSSQRPFVKADFEI